MKPESAVMSIEPKLKGRPQSDRVAQAVRLVQAGMTQYKAHKFAECSASGLYKALKRERANPALAHAEKTEA